MKSIMKIYKDGSEALRNQLFGDEEAKVIIKDLRKEAKTGKNQMKYRLVNMSLRG